MVVHIVQENRKKSFLGGYKHRLTGWSSKLRLLKYSFVLFFFQERRNEEMALIDELYSGPERKAAPVGLLEQEAHLIASIHRHKLVADEENKDERIKSFLNKVCSTCLFL